LLEVFGDGDSHLNTGLTGNALFDKAGIGQNLDQAFMALKSPSDAATFIKACRALRFWDREAKVNVV
jgi:hypothetical protein